MQGAEDSQSLNCGACAYLPEAEVIKEVAQCVGRLKFFVRKEHRLHRGSTSNFGLDLRPFGLVNHGVLRGAGQTGKGGLSQGGERLGFNELRDYICIPVKWSSQAVLDSR